MRRKSLLLALGMIALILGTILTTLYVLYKREPSFYHATTMPEGVERSEESREFLIRSGNLYNAVLNGYADWYEIFTVDQINAFLQEDFIPSWGEEYLPDGFHDLRVRIEAGEIVLGCRYGNGFWSTILSIELRIWLVANPGNEITEMNKVAVEVVNLRAGVLPISRQIVLDQITEIAHRKNIDVKWYHREGNPVAILKLQADQPRPTILLQRFELQPGKIVIVGRSTENSFAHGPPKPAN